MSETRKAEHSAPLSQAAQQATQQDWRIVCDFDGTITPFDVTDAILTRFADPSWEEVEREWLAGAMTARACMDRQVRLIDVSVPELDAWLDTVPVTEGFQEFASLCKTRGLSLTVVSDGLDYAIRRVLSRHGVGDIPVIANRLRFQGTSGYKLEFPYGVEGCPSGVCKCGVAKAMGGKALLIGDGHSDCCVAGVADLVFAKEDKELLRRCRAKNYPHQVFNDFFDVAALLEKLLQEHGPKARTEQICAAD